MATFNSVDTFRDPEKLDIMSTLGTAMSYLQQNYDQNVAETQALINQYVGTDLIRGIDKNYLGDRLQTLVEYINTSGSKNWSKKSVARDVQNYIGTAIDGNVMAAIASTQALRKLDAEIDKHKKDGKGYSIQNEWVAKMDLQRYMNSGELGDVFRAGTYTPYRDVNDKIMKHADTLKNFGAEFVPFSKDAGGGGFFRMIGTREVLSPQKVKSFLGSILDAGDMQQLQIDGMYSMKDKSEEEVRSLYNGVIDNRITALDRAIESAKLDMTDASAEDKVKLQNNIDAWETEKQNEIIRKGRNLDKNTMAGAYYQSNFIDGYSNFMSYNRIKDFKIDDSLFQLYKHSVEVEQFNKNYELNVEKFNAENQRWSADYALKQQELEAKREANLINAAGSGVKKGADGNYYVDPNSNPGILMTPDTNQAKPEEKKNAYTDAYKEANESWDSVVQTITDKRGDINAVIENDKGLKHLTEVSPGTIAGFLVNRPGGSQRLFNMLPPDVKQAIINARMAKQKMDNYDANITSKGGYMDSIREVADGIRNAGTKESTKEQARKALNGKVISNEGKLVDGDLATHKGKYADLTAQVAVLSNEIRFADTDDERNFRKRALELTLAKSGLGIEQQKKILEQAYKGSTIEIFDGKAAKNFGDGWSKIVDAWEGRGGFIDGMRKIGRGAYEAVVGTIGNTGAKAADKMFNVNRSVNDLGETSFFGAVDADIVTKTPISKIQSNMRQQYNAAMDKVRKDLTHEVGKSMNIDMDNKASKDIASQVLMTLPPEIGAKVAGGHMKIGEYDPEAKTVKVSVPVKVGKGEVAIEETHVPVASLPASLQGSIMQGAAASNPYNIQNPYAMGYSRNMTLPKNIFEAQALKDGLSLEDKLTTPTVPTQSVIVQQALAGAPEELVKLHKKEINELVKSDYQFSLEKGDGQWIAVVKRNGSHFYAQPTGQAEYSPEKVRTLADQIIPQAIVANIRALVGN